jgi:hypothetical protein
MVSTSLSYRVRVAYGISPKTIGCQHTDLEREIAAIAPRDDCRDPPPFWLDLFGLTPLGEFVSDAATDL